MNAGGTSVPYFDSVRVRFAPALITFSNGTAPSSSPMRTRAQNAGWAPSGLSAWTGRWSEVEGTSNAPCASTSPITTSIGPIERGNCILPLIGQTDHDCKNMNE